MYYVYITTNKNHTTLYTGVTNKLERRMFEHIAKENPNSFTAKYNINKLVYYEIFSKIEDAISAEKRIKGWKRDKKTKLIESMNLEWDDLFEE